ncbi:MAG: glycoside hydrolase family 9 protein [Saprospiraceae bacterium]|nr:glycoside hydrolase family 9 protein [Saprospiraceae bacterium]
MKPNIVVSFLFLPVFLFAQNYQQSNQLKIDQIGYLPTVDKIAVISQAQSGYNALETYEPSSTLQIRSLGDDSVVYSGDIAVWGNGQVHEQSGDKVWHFDFSEVQMQGEYYVYDPVNQVGSYPFKIADDIYNEALKLAVRTFYYQRCGTDKPETYAGAAFADGVNFMGAQQDTDCRLYSNTDASTSRDLQGGWFDAGDYNKYVNFAYQPMVDLLFAYLYYPEIWTDDYNIPESGNGVPDLLDEVKWELDWLLRMQEVDGGILSVVGGGYVSPPSAETAPRFYGPATTAASYSAATMMALGSIVFEEVGNTAYAKTLLDAAIAAYDWAGSNPNQVFYNSGQLAAGEQQLDDYNTKMRQLTSAIFLYAKTGEGSYQTFVENNYADSHLQQWGWASMYEEPYHKAMLFYTQQFGVGSSVSDEIIGDYVNSVKNAGDHLPSYQNGEDPYLAYLGTQNYTWGSNNTKGGQANIFLNMIHFGLDTDNDEVYKAAAAGYVHYFHGLNPNNLVYLTKMEAYGGDNSCQEMYHSWFGDGTAWDNNPPPAYVVGGPNPSYSMDGCCNTNSCANLNNLCDAGSLTPPFGQPAQKAYKDFNTSWPQNSWQLSEPAIYYQSSYIKVLAAFTAAMTPTSAEDPETVPLKVNIFPNPTRGMIQVNALEEGIAGIKLFDAAGRLVWQQQREDFPRRWELSLERFDSGLYLLEIQGRSGRRVVKKVDRF